MKRYGCLILCLALLLLSGCSLLRDPGRSSASAQPPETADGPEEDVISEPEGGEFLSRCGYEVMWIGTDAYGIVSCEEGDFSTLVSFPMSQLWEEGTGLYLSMKISRPGTIPYVIVSRNRGVSLDAEEYLKASGIESLRLAINKGNPQATHFWEKNGFVVFREAEKDGRALLEAEKKL